MKRNERMMYIILDILEKKLGSNEDGTVCKSLTYSEIFEEVYLRVYEEDLDYPPQDYPYALHCIVQLKYVVHADKNKPFIYEYGMDHGAHIDVAFSDITKAGHDFLERWRKKETPLYYSKK